VAMRSCAENIIILHILVELEGNEAYGRSGARNTSFLNTNSKPRGTSFMTSQKKEKYCYPDSRMLMNAQVEQARDRGTMAEPGAGTTMISGREFWRKGLRNLPTWPS